MYSRGHEQCARARGQAHPARLQHARPPRRPQRRKLLHTDLMAYMVCVDGNEREW